MNWKKIFAFSVFSISVVLLLHKGRTILSVDKEASAFPSHASVQQGYVRSILFLDVFQHTLYFLSSISNFFQILGGSVVGLLYQEG